MYINTNGIVSFNFFDFINDGTYYDYPNNLFTALTPFWSDIDTTSCGDIYYRETLNIQTLNRISIDIQNSLKINFRATWAFIVTFDRVCKYSSFSNSIVNSFQIVITADGSTSYVIYNYGQLFWFEDYTSYALYNAGDGIRYSILPGSLTSDILKLSYLSNVGEPGKWIFNTSNTYSLGTTLTAFSKK